ncbi:MAG: tyrosine--tRNA ligase, partial [Candidatus Caldarchaeum sp.]|nr:tyrosine--tRNA ligase [Candidatus Caldarchaeum sp.]MDW8434899.1 tyrosine--tRNA ligase [Candidatus Caldarchaeum sp.]
GFEPSGLAHIPFALLRAIKLRDMLEAGCRFKLLLADWHAAINRKMGGDLEKIRKVGEYFIEVWKASGIDVNKVEIVWASDMASDRDYWKLVIEVLRNTTLRRVLRCLPIMGRKEGELQEAAQMLYPGMQVADIFKLEAKICQLGLDQRRANILARELGPKLGFWKPVAVHHHMLMGLSGPTGPMGLEEEEELDVQISSKMSKSVPESSIYVHDDHETIKRKIYNAYCPPKQANGNPVLEYCRYVIFPLTKSIRVDRPSKFGGEITYHDYGSLEKDYVEGRLHPLDLKNTVAEYLNQLLTPIRTWFESSSKARELYEFVKEQEITR